jgi:hypothetical protein
MRMAGECLQDSSDLAVQSISPCLSHCAFEDRSERQADAKVGPWERAIDNLDGAPMRLYKL